jgi:predicted nucleic acid-binding protein
MKVLLDTSACLAHFRGEPGADQVQELFVRDDVDILLCSLTLAEMARRLRELGVPKGEIWRIVADYEDLAVEVVPVGAEVARKSDEICLKTASRLPLADALIAAAAAWRGATLVHRDTHMQPIPRSQLRQIDLAEDGKT